MEQLMGENAYLLTDAALLISAFVVEYELYQQQWDDENWYFSGVFCGKAFTTLWMGLWELLDQQLA